MASPLISIITVSLNAEKHIEQTIQSVLGQTWRPVEYIVVDGGSSDGTLAVVSRYKDRIAHVVSEKDEGIADAMNKGLALARGDYVLFLQADDYLKEKDSLERALQFADDADLIACDIEFGKAFTLQRPRGFTPWFNFKGMPHQGILCRRSLLNELNGFDRRFRICMDYDFLLRAYRRGARLVKAPVVLTVMRDTGISSRREWKHLKERFDEERLAHDKNCPSTPMALIYRLYWFFYLLYRRVRCLLEEERKGNGVDIKNLSVRITKFFVKKARNTIQSVLLSYPKKVQCNVCGWEGRHFLSDSWHKHITCPKCRAEVRHRLFIATLKNIETLSFERIMSRKKILHFAPEDIIRLMIQEKSSDYVTADYSRPDCDLKLDMSDMPEVKDESFNVVIAFDVLEHVPDYLKALGEVHRVLSEKGFAVFTVPQKDNLAVTYEDSNIVTPEERTRYFGQYNHLRIFGDDFPDIVTNKGFSVTVVNESMFPEAMKTKHVLSPPMLSRQSLATNYRKVFFCQKSFRKAS